MKKNETEYHTYVSLTPYIRIDNEQRHRANIFTSMSYTSDEIKTRIDNDAAIAFIEKATAQVEQTCEQSNQIPLVIGFQAELSFFVDERVRTDKNYEMKDEDDILSGINCLTIYPPVYNSPIDSRKTFIVDLDKLGDTLKRLGYLADFSSENFSSDWIRTAVSRHGFGISPKLDFTKNYQKVTEQRRHKL